MQFPVNVRTASRATLVLANLRAEPQPASLLQVPQGCRGLDPRALIGRIKHSDVWAGATN